MRRIFRIAGILLLLLLFVTMGPRVLEGYQTKKRVAAIVQSAESIRGRVDQFYSAQKRLPTAQEAASFRINGDGYFKSIVYDADKKMVVVTMEIRDEQFAMRAEVKDGAIHWICRTINYRAQDLPPNCR